MPPETKTPSKLRNSLTLILLVVAFLAVTTVAISQKVDLGQFMRMLTGSLTDASRYALPAPDSKTPNTPVIPAQGKLTVNVDPNYGKFEVKNAVTGDLEAVEQTGFGTFKLAPGNYSVIFKAIPNYDTPVAASAEVLPDVETKISTRYVAWPACTANDWKCADWTACAKGTEFRRRPCTQANPRCTNADLVQPMLYEVCAECKKEKRC